MATVDGGVVVKKYLRQKGLVILRSANPKYADIMIVKGVVCQKAISGDVDQAYNAAAADAQTSQSTYCIISEARGMTLSRGGSARTAACASYPSDAAVRR